MLMNFKLTYVNGLCPKHQGDLFFSNIAPFASPLALSQIETNFSAVSNPFTMITLKSYNCLMVF